MQHPEPSLGGVRLTLHCRSDAADKKRDDKRAAEGGKEALTFENLMNSPWKVCGALWCECDLIARQWMSRHRHCSPAGCVESRPATLLETVLKCVACCAFRQNCAAGLLALCPQRYPQPRYVFLNPKP